MGIELQNEIDAKASRAPRVTPADIEAEIDSEHYFTAEDGVVGVLATRDADGLKEGDTATVGVASVPDPLALLTFCVLVLKNGYTVTGESACASPENFNAEIGRKVARENAISKVWPLLGFRLRDRLAEFSPPASQAPRLPPHQQRVVFEHQDLCQRLHRLQAFLGSATYASLPEAERLRLRRQFEHMTAYEQVLRDRIVAFSIA